MTLLTYSYAIGLYGSEEIADRISIDPQLLYLSAKAGISGNDLRHFRRYHRPWLQQALGMVLELAHETRPSPWATKFSDHPQKRLGQPGGDLRALCRQAAERRINEAVLRDTMALDG